MKKVIFLFLLSSLVQGVLISQDLVVTSEGDSINCKITKIKSEYIYFTFKHENEVRNTLLPLGSVKNHQYNWYTVPEVKKQQINRYQNFDRFRLAVNVGYSYQSAKISENNPSDFEEYMKDLRSGYHIGADFFYYITEPIGFGLKYSMFRTSNQMENIYLTDPYGTRHYGNMADDIRITFIGPTFSTRMLNKNKSGAFLMNMAIGYLGYNNDFILIDEYSMNGSTAGYIYEMGYDWMLGGNTFLGLQMSYLGGNLFSYELTKGTYTEKVELDPEVDELISTSRFDFSVGLRFAF
ncbi:MAG: hypothetical protein ACOCWA_02460 [Bacteroidota bacterium]